MTADEVPAEPEVIEIDPRDIARRVQPFFDQVVVMPLVEQASAVIEVVTDGQQLPAKAEVIAAGPHCEFAKPGDLVLMEKYQGLLFEIEGATLMVIREKALVGRVLDEPLNES